MKLSVIIGIMAVVGLLTGIILASSSNESSSIQCDPAYPDVCIPEYPPDLDCGHIQYNDFKVVSPDRHGFDRDKDGIGCETYP